MVRRHRKAHHQTEPNPDHFSKSTTLPGWVCRICTLNSGRPPVMNTQQVAIHEKSPGHVRAVADQAALKQLENLPPGQKLYVEHVKKVEGVKFKINAVIDFWRESVAASEDTDADDNVIGYDALFERLLDKSTRSPFEWTPDMPMGGYANAEHGYGGHCGWGSDVQVEGSSLRRSNPGGAGQIHPWTSAAEPAIANERIDQEDHPRSYNYLWEAPWIDSWGETPAEQPLQRANADDGWKGHSTWGAAPQARHSSQEQLHRHPDGSVDSSHRGSGSGHALPRHIEGFPQFAKLKPDQQLAKIRESIHQLRQATSS